MNERTYLFIVGIYILSALYLELDLMIYALAIWLAFEGFTDFRITTTLQKMRKVTLDTGLLYVSTAPVFKVEAIRAWRIVVSTILILSYLLVHEYQVEVIWFFPWFMGFAIMGAGASGVCPVMLGLKWVGFR